MFNLKETPVICSDMVRNYFPQDFLKQASYITDEIEKKILKSNTTLNLTCLTAVKFRDIGYKTHRINFVIFSNEIDRAYRFSLYYGDDGIVKLVLKQEENTIMKMTFIKLEESTDIFISILNELF